jgi:hypothetical protein
MEEPARLFYCGRCQAMVRICRQCDRGQIYCSPDCADLARRHGQREAGRRYQQSRPGRFHHAARARAYRARQKIVTHHGSEMATVDAVLAAMPLAVPEPDERRVAEPGQAALEVCCRCGTACGSAVRLDFLGTRVRRRPSWTRAP